MRSRNIKPGFFKDEKVLKCCPLARILFEGLWCYADREGKFKWNPFEVKIEILPFDDCNVMELLNELIKNELIIKYSIKSKEYGYIPNFLKHQHPHIKEKDSAIPSPEKHSANTIQEPDKNNACPSDSLIPDSLIPKETSLRKEVPFKFPTQEEINESSEPKLKKDLKKICDELYNQEIFPKVHAFSNMMLKQEKNSRAIIHALGRCYLKRPLPDQAWGYCVQIMKVEDGNYNEREHGKTI